MLAYKWTAATWDEIDSGVVGLCAYEEWEKGQGPGEAGGMYVVEWVSALRGGGLATQMLREARGRGREGRDRTELQVHVANRRAKAYYERLGMRRCRWWEWGEGQEGDERRLCGDGGGSLYEPRVGYQMMQVREQELERALQERAGYRAPVTGVEYVWAAGVGGLRDAGVLKGVRAMVARVYGGEDWFVRDEGGTGRAECLYERKGGRGGGVRFIVARQTADDRWARGRAAHEAGDEARSRQEAPSRCLNGPLSNTPWGVNQRTEEGAGIRGRERRPQR